MEKKLLGFTLIELVLVIALVSVITVISAVLLNQGLHAYISFQNTTVADGQLRLALETLGREIRNIRYVSDISIATASQLSFVDTAGKTITFSYSANTLTENNQVLATDISAFTFTYYTSTLTPTTTASAIAFVQLNLSYTANNTATTTQLIWFPRNALP